MKNVIITGFKPGTWAFLAQAINHGSLGLGVYNTIEQYRLRTCHLVFLAPTSYLIKLQDRFL